MQNKLKIIFICLLFITAVLMELLSLQVKNGSDNSYLYITPKNKGQAKIPLNNTEDLDDLLLTYEAASIANVSVLNQQHRVTLVKTNYMYPFVYDYPIESGSFFLLSQQEQKQNVAALNKTAAFEILGSLNPGRCELKVNQTSYLVIGVIDDGYEEPILYIPASLDNTNSADNVAARLIPEQGQPYEYVSNRLKTAGIDDSGYDIYNFRLLTGAITIRRDVAYYVVLIFILLNIIVLCLRRLIRKIYTFKLSQNRELKKDIPTFIFLTAVISLCAYLAYYFGLTALNGFLSLNDLTSGFPAEAGVIQQLSQYSSILMSIMIAGGLCLLLLGTIPRKPRRL